jgi:hypothetical protein
MTRASQVAKVEGVKVRSDHVASDKEISMQNNNRSTFILDMITLAVLLLTLILLLSRFFLASAGSNNSNGLPGGGGQVVPASQQAYIASESNRIPTSIPGLFIEIQNA